MTPKLIDGFVILGCWVATFVFAATTDDAQTYVLLAIGATVGIVLRRLNAWAFGAE